ncbi:MAG: CoA transferase [Microbacterium sp.]|uniref:CaiB/BaiF CoA transferase family protein n=1 Tax=Microbacterium sp. TaxID=51671 RepID=UPI001AC8443B|nr:CoA transferase [Microbacterium sp.]MBN9155544.1 CoA transferase [Microbacterium sp.]
MVEPRKPLAGVRVLELGALVAAPYCGMLLADLGADVIKVEPPEGDMAREFPPFENGESTFFLAVNRGKRSVSVDLRTEQSREQVRALALSSDVVLHNYRTGVAERLGLGYEDLASENPALVYCSISGFGPTGPMAQRPGIDLLFQAESGMMAITGERGGKPVKVGTNAADVYAATVASSCILAALVERSSTGRGARIDVPLRDAFLALQACWFTGFLATGEQPERLGAGSPFTAPTDVYPTRDDVIVLAVVNQKHWRILCTTLGAPEWIEDARFKDNAGRVRHASVLASLVSDALAVRTTDEWIGVFEEAGIPAGRVLDYNAVAGDEQISHNEMILNFIHPTAGPIRTQGIPFWIDGRKPAQPSAPPVLGAHTDETLRSLVAGRSPWVR